MAEAVASPPAAAAALLLLLLPLLLLYIRPFSGPHFIERKVGRYKIIIFYCS
jgi:hypothetical protein